MKGEGYLLPMMTYHVHTVSRREDGILKRGKSRSRRGGWKAGMGVLILIVLGVGGGGLSLVWSSGYGTAEILRYLGHRAEGHPRLESITRPLFAEILTLMGESSLAADEPPPPFYVPPPPVRWGAATMAADEADGWLRPYLPGLVWPAPKVNPRVLRVGPHQPIQSISVAAASARDGDVVEIEAGDYHLDVAAVWTQDRLTIRAVGGAVRLFADGNSAEGKAIWVIRGGNIQIEGIGFLNARVADRNGAGIRFEQGNLWLRHCLFYASENGLLTSDNDQASLVIEDSEFGYDGAGDGYSHDLYVGKIKFLGVVGSYFHHANVGHLFKSRALTTVLLYSRLTDESGGRASYELDLPNGGMALVLGSVIQQGMDTENTTVISYGEEGLGKLDNRLVLSSNTLVNDKAMAGAFLRAPQAVEVISVNNLLVGFGDYHVQGSLVRTNDQNVNWEVFHQPMRQDYRLNAPVPDSLRYVVPVAVTGLPWDIVPQAEMPLPGRLQQLKGAPRYVGAEQSVWSGGPR